MREIGDDIWLQVARGIVYFVDQLLLARRFGHPAARMRHLRDDDRAVRVDLADRESKPREIRDVLETRIGEIAARHLPCALEQMPNHGGLAEPVPVAHVPAEFVDERRREQRGIRHASRQHDVRAGRQRVDKRRGAQIGCPP